MDLGDQITTLSRTLSELIKLWERFFAGDIRVPPQNQRINLERRLRQLHDRPGVMRSSDRFRLEQLQHRFMTYSMNWERMLREREEGRGRSAAHLRAVSRASKPAPPPPPPNAQRPAAVDPSGADLLFNRYQAAKDKLGQKSGLGREAFKKQIAEQRKGLEKRLGRKVDFDVAVSDGRVKLVVKKDSAAEDQG